jgi:hypothetical protein
MGVYEKEGVCVPFVDPQNEGRTWLAFNDGTTANLFSFFPEGTTFWFWRWPFPPDIRAWRVHIRIEAEPLSDEEAREYWEGEK